MSGQEDEIEISFKSETGELFTLDKKERKLLRVVLSVALSYERTRSVIAKKLGEESLAIAENLLREVGVNLSNSDADPFEKQRHSEESISGKSLLRPVYLLNEVGSVIDMFFRE